jgi:hypothetical protein
MKTQVACVSVSYTIECGANPYDLKTITDAIGKQFPQAAITKSNVFDLGDRQVLSLEVSFKTAKDAWVNADKIQVLIENDCRMWTLDEINEQECPHCGELVLRHHPWQGLDGECAQTLHSLLQYWNENVTRNPS